MGEDAGKGINVQLSAASWFVLGLLAGYMAYPAWVAQMTSDIEAEASHEAPSCPDGYSMRVAGYAYTVTGYKAHYACVKGIPVESDAAFRDRVENWD